MEQQGSGMQSVVKALRVLEAVAGRQPVGVGEISRQLGLPKSTVQRCLVTLRDAGWLRPASEAAGSWSLTAHALSVGRRAEAELVAAAQVPMRALRDRMDETVHLAVRDGDQAVIVDRVESGQTLRVSRAIGTRTPLYETSAGEAILAALPASERERLGSAPGRTAAGHAIREAGDVEGDSYHLRQHEDGVYGLSAAVLDEHGRPVAALIASIPESRFRPDRLEQWNAWVVEGAREIERNMGVVPPRAPVSATAERSPAAG